MPKDWQNSEGYSDPTAYKAQREMSDEDRRLAELIGHLKYVIRAAGYDLEERIVLRDRRTGKIHR